MRMNKDKNCKFLRVKSESKHIAKKFLIKKFKFKEWKILEF